MRKGILISLIALSVVGVSFLGTAKTAEALGCVCEFNAASENPRDGVLRAVDDGRDCAIIFGKTSGGVAKVGIGVTAPQPSTEVLVDSVNGCDPFSSSIDPGFTVPTFSVIMGSLIRLIFFMAGLIALVFLLLGGLAWVQSAGEEKKVEAAQKKITASVIGLVVMIAVLSLVIFLEQVVFGGKFCLGISCPMNISFLQLIR